MVGRLISIEAGPKRNVGLAISATEIQSEMASPGGCVDPRRIDHYELMGMHQPEGGLVTLTLVMSDRSRVRFYATESKFDMALLLDELDAAIGMRPRQFTSS